VCVNDSEGINTALLLGIGYNDDWDVAIAERGIGVHQFDHSIDEPPHMHQNWFTKKKIVSRDDGTPNVETLGRLVDVQKGLFTCAKDGDYFCIGVGFCSGHAHRG